MTSPTAPQPSEYRALLLDLSGVIYEGSRVIDGALDSIAQARQQPKILRFVTNTATQATRAILQKLQDMGIEIQDGELLTAPMAAKAYLQQHSLRPYCLIHDALREDFADLPQDDPNAVLLGDARDALNFHNLNQAFRLCKQGAPLIGIGMNRFYKDDDGLTLDAGGFIRLIEWAADTEAIIMGKPSPEFFAQVVASTGVPAGECLMVGDDVSADVMGAIDAGLQGCLVKTGKYQVGDEQTLPKDAHVIDSIKLLL